MRKFMMLFLVMVVIFGVSCSARYNFLDLLPVVGDVGDGEDVEEEIVDGVYLISHASQLMLLSKKSAEDMVNITNVKFMADIDMTNRSFYGITTFSGLMDGNYKKIKNLNIVANSKRELGLINTLDNGTIKNLTVESGLVKVTSGVIVAGMFVGIATGTSTFEGLVNRANVDGGEFDISLGGIVGKLETNGVFVIEKVQNFGDITGTYKLESFVGGIVGLVDLGSEVTISNVGNVGRVDGRVNAGIIGQVGVNENTSSKPILTIHNVYNYGEIVENSSSSSSSHIITQNYGTVTIGSSFYLRGAAAGAVDGKSLTGVLLATATGFKDETTFTNWDFAKVWQMGGDYPILK